MFSLIAAKADRGGVALMNIFRFLMCAGLPVSSAVPEDGNTLTMTVHQAGRSKPVILVFDREEAR